MTVLIARSGLVRTALTSSKSSPGFPHIAIQRQPTDPYYYADVDIANMIVGSRYMLGYDDDGVFTSLSSGTAAVSDFTISLVPAYDSPSFLLALRVRKASAATKYSPDVFYTEHSSSGSNIYVSQREEETGT